MNIATETIPALVWCPFPDAIVAASVAERLLDDGLIACANILPAMTALYVWNGERGTSDEVGVLFKTNSGALDELTERIVDLHPYDTPAVLGWHCDAASSGTSAWLASMGR